MSEETLKQMQDRHALLMAARDPRTNERIFERDKKYAREVFALGVQIEERKAAEAARPQINQQQLEQIAWLNRLRGVRDADGKPLLFDTGPNGRTFRTKLDRAQAAIERGEDITPLITATTNDMAARKLTLPAPAVDQSAIVQQRAASRSGGYLPPAPATVSASQLGGGSAQATPLSTMEPK